MSPTKQAAVDKRYGSLRPFKAQGIRSSRICKTRRTSKQKIPMIRLNSPKQLHITFQQARHQQLATNRNTTRKNTRNSDTNTSLHNYISINTYLHTPELHQDTPKEPTQISDNETATDEFSLRPEHGELYGDMMQPKRSGTFRIGFHNINKLPISRHSPKSKEKIWQIAQGNFDVLMMTEIGVCHAKLTADDQWEERTIPYLRDYGSKFAYNKTELDITQQVQYGGVGILTNVEARHRIIASSEDPSGLGRWTSISIQGKEGHVTSFVSVYRPCKNTGASSVYVQHLRNLPLHQEPRQAILEDLHPILEQFIDMGHHLVVGMDANENVTKGQVHTLMTSLGLRDAVISHNHPQKPPATYNRNAAEYPIDAIWISPSITVDRAGYTAFDEGVPSDHRCLWLDVSYSIAFGQKSPPIKPGSPRRLKASDPRLVKRYNQSVKALFNRLNLFKKMERIRNKAIKKGWNPKLEKQYNALHRTALAIRLQIEKKIRKLPMGNKPWSPKLQRYRDIISLWEMMVRRQRRTKVSLSRIRRFIKKLGLQEILTTPLAECLLERDKAYKEYRLAASKASNWRDDFQDDLMEALAQANNSSREKEIKKMKMHEKQRKQSRNVKRARGKLGGGKVTKVYVTEDSGVRKECNTKQTMEDAIITENVSRFSQSESTVAMEYPLLFDMGMFGETAEAEDVLLGLYDIPESLPKYSKAFLNALTMTSDRLSLGRSTLVIPLHEHKKAWEKQKECTSAEPSGPSFSHYKASSEDDELAQFDCFIRELPYRFGFSPESWQHITDVSILKKLGVYDVDKMRTIQLMHAEFNLNNKKLGRDVMRTAEDLYLLPEDQSGSRKRHRAIMAALNKRLTTDIWRQRKQAGAICANDAKSCYDRIVHWVASLCLRWAGLAKEPVYSMFLTLASAVHVVSTAFGISSKSYNKNRNPPCQGVGQGNGSGPAVWAVISAVLIRMMYAEGHGVSFLASLSLTLTAFVCYAFVDDTDLVQVGPSLESTGEEVAALLQKSVNCWEGGLRTTGGALVPKKSHWYLVDFIWRNDRWEYRNIDEMAAALTVTNTCGTKSAVLARHEVWHAEETLGVKLSMDGNNKDQVQLLLSKTTEFALQMKTSKLSHSDVWYAIETSIMKTIEYCIPAVTLSKSDWKTVLAPLMKWALPAAGYDRSFPRRILFAPKSLQGVGLIHPWHRQGLGHLTDLITQTMNPRSLTGHLLQTSLEDLRLELGISKQFWDENAQKFKSITTPSWIADLWSYTSEHNIRIKDPFPCLSTYREKDVLLMDVLSSKYTHEQLRRLNFCRLFLQVTCLSEITTVDGLQITNAAWYGRRDDRWNGFVWPKSPKTLPRKWWDLWQTALTDQFCKPNSRVLRQPLGTCTTEPYQWTWFYSPSEDNLYRREGHMWRSFPKVLRARSTRRRDIYIRNDYISSPPYDLLHARVYPTSVNSFSLDGGPVALKVEPLGSPSGPLMNPTLVHEWECQSGTLDDLADAIRRGQCMIVSDGSFKNGRCTSAFILASTEQDARVLGVNAVPGPIAHSNSFRGELSGSAGALEFLRWMLVKYKIKSGSAVLLLDGEAALNQAKSDLPIKATQPSYDILQVIRAHTKDLPISVTWEWVEGHQEGDDLPLAARLNKKCDEAAKQFWQHMDEQDSWQHSQTLGEAWEVWLGEEKLTSLDFSQLYQWAITTDEELSPKTYWKKKHELPIDEFDHIDWEANHRAIRAMPAAKQRFLPKFLTGFCGTNQREAFRTGGSSQCPRCSQPIEDARHVLKCQGSGADEVWDTGMLKLQGAMDFLNTDSRIQQVLMSRLSSWHSETSLEEIDLPIRHKDISEATKAQDKIGWNNFVMGRISKFWAKCQERRYKEAGKRNSGRRWATAIIKKLFAVSWDMWDHRNNVKHSPSHPNHVLLSLELQAQIQLLRQTDTSSWLPTERAVVQVTDTQVQLWPIPHMHQWIASVHAIQQRVRRRIRDRQHSSRQQRQFMEQWLSKKSV